MNFASVLALVLSCFLFVSTLCDQPTREALEVIIGGGSGSPPPPPDSQCCPASPAPAPVPAPLVFESKRIELVYPVIQKFKERIESDPFHVTSTWDGPDICNKYRGFFCDFLLDYNQTVLAGVKFNGFYFDGPNLGVDGFIDQLPDLIVFHANSNSFKGAIPMEISQLKYLYELDLSNNKYTCSFPYQVLAASRLTFLDLRFNSLSGRVPAPVFRLDLDVLFINNNKFTQSLPDNLGCTTALYVVLANNKFTGPIPRSIGLTGKTLLEILLLNNNLSGCIPREIGLLEKATVFDASYNFLTGPIPKSFGCLAEMEIFNLEHNRLHGPVPEFLCKLPNLYNFSLSYNYFTEIGPECLKLIQECVLDVDMNCIPGLPRQRSKADCGRFLARAPSCGSKEYVNWSPCNASLQENHPKRARKLQSSLRRVEPKHSYAMLSPHRL